jgi:hypothetical protein
MQSVLPFLDVGDGVYMAVFVWGLIEERFGVRVSQEIYISDVYIAGSCVSSFGDLLGAD